MENRRDSGFALVTAVWITLLLSLLAAGLMRLALTSRLSTASMELELEDQSLAQTAIEVFMSQYFYNADEQTYQNADFELNGRQVSVIVHFESGKINVNRADVELLSALFAAKGVEGGRATALAAAIIDWRDADTLPLPNGAEVDAYQAAAYSVHPRNGAFETVGEVRQVFGMTSEIFQCASPDLTVYSLTGNIDIPRASSSVREILFWAYENEWQDGIWPDPSDAAFTAPSNVIDDVGGHALTLEVKIDGDVPKHYSQRVRFKTLTDRTDFARLSPIKASVLDPINVCSED